MEKIIGEEGSPNLPDVTKAIENSNSFAQLANKWIRFGEELEIRDEVMSDLKLRLNQEIYEIGDLPRRILKIWKANQGKNATLQMLCSALEDCRIRNIADELRSEFGGEGPQKKLRFRLHRKVYTWNDLLGKNASDKLYQRIEKTSSKDSPIVVIREHVFPHDLPEYYISRDFSYHSQIDEQIFRDDSTKDHIFIVKGASKSKLARVCDYEKIENSRNQLDRINVRFIMLGMEEDFNKICKMASNPVHKIEYKNKRFFWILSTQSCEVIRRFLIKNGETFTEVDVISKITSLRCPSALSIADTPGMGKTFLLTNLAMKIGETKPNAVVLFIVLQEFVQKMDIPGLTLDSVLRFVSTNYEMKSILEEMLTNGTFHFFLFLDGYDEVLRDKLHLVDSFLQTLIQTKNIRVIITTRPHLKSRLEDILNSFSFEMLPFDDFNQVEFLTKYWMSNHGAEHSKSLIEFAKKCLKKVNTIMTDTERNIAGVPLQCMMLAEVCAADAIRASNEEQIPEDVVKIFSFFQMYKALIDLKLSKISDRATRQKYLDAHVYESIALLFPEWLEKFKPHLSPRNDIDTITLYSVGLLEKTPCSDVPRFVHRTFAEYVLADFIARSLNRSATCAKFLFEEILGQMGTTEELRTNFEVIVQPTLYKLKHPAITYFLDMHLRGRFCNTENSMSLTTMDLQNITENDIFIAAAVCCCNDLESCFELIANIVERLSISDIATIRNKYIKHLLYLVVENTNNESFVRSVLHFTNSKFGLNLNSCNFEGEYMFNGELFITNATPLHVSVNKGKYNMTMYLLKEYGDDVLCMEHLLHPCVHSTVGSRDSVIEEKLSIIEALTRINKEWLDDEIQGKSPLLHRHVHVKIIKKLVKLGANINAHSSSWGTLLHTMKVYDDNMIEKPYADKLRWAVKNGFQLFNHTNGESLTVLMYAIKYCRNLDNEALGMFYEVGANFNEQDCHGDSVLFHAIQNSESVHFIQNILDFGANIDHINYAGRNAAHVAMHNLDWESNQHVLVEIFKLLKSRGFNGWDQTDNDGCTPLMHGIETRVILSDQLLQFFLALEVNFNAQNNGGDSVLFYAIKHSDNIDFTKKLFDFKTNPNHKNKIGQNVADIAICAYESNPAEMKKMLELLVSKGFDGINQCVLSTGDLSQIISACRERLITFFKSVSKTTDENGDTILFHAIRYFFKLELVSLILEQGVDVNHQNNLGENIAHYVMKYLKRGEVPTINMFELLKSRGFAGLDQKNYNGQTPLMIGIQFRKGMSTGVLRYLCNDVDFNAQCNSGFSVLTYTIKYSKQLSYIKTILDFGVNPNHKSKTGRNAAHQVLERIKNCVIATDALKLLKSKGFDGFNEKDSYGCTPVIHAMAHGTILKKCTLKFLLEEGVDINAESDNGRSVLFYAMQFSGDIDFIQRILDFGANPNHKMKLGINAAHLILVCHRNDPTFTLHVLKLLKTKGFDGYNKKCDGGFAPIMYAIMIKSVLQDDILQFLAKVEVDFNAQDNDGNSVLFYAIELPKNLGFIQKILSYGANPNHVNAFGENAAHLVMRCYQNDPNLVVDVLKLLKSRGFNGLNQKSHHGIYPFMKAIVFRGILEDEVLQYLSEEGVTVDFNAQDDDGDSVLFYALDLRFRAANLDIIKKLLDFGANPTHKNFKDQNAGHFIFLFCHKCKSDGKELLDNEGKQEVEDPKAVLEILKLLESKGYEGFNEKDSNGDTPLTLAISKNIADDELLNFLRERTLE